MNAMSATAKTDSAAEVETALTRVIAQIIEIQEQMRVDDAEIGRIRAETAALKTETAALKTEAAALKMETRTILARLGSAV